MPLSSLRPLVAATLAVAGFAGPLFPGDQPTLAVVSAGSLNGDEQPNKSGGATRGPAVLDDMRMPPPPPVPVAPPVWQKVDQTARVKRDGLYNYNTNTWNVKAFKPLGRTQPRFIEPGVLGGPKVPPTAITNPDQYTWLSIQKKNMDPVKNLDYYKSKLMQPLLEKFVFPGAGKDEVPGMPVEMVRALQTHLQPGDVILQSNDPGDAKEKLRNQFMHGMLYIGRGLVVHAIGVPRATRFGELKPSVFLSAFDQALTRDVDGADRLVVLRPRHTAQADFNKIVEFAVGEVGKPYDFSLNTQDNVRYYCTEVPVHAYKLMAQPIALAPDTTMPLKPVTGNSYLAAMERGDFDLILVLNPKVKADALYK